MTKEQQDKLRRALYNAKFTTDAHDENPFVGIYFNDLLDIIHDFGQQHPQWIPVEEELPPENGKTQQSTSVWATNGLMSCEMRYNFDTKKWTDMWGDPFDVTHWMPLPVPPRKEDKK